MDLAAEDGENLVVRHVLLPEPEPDRLEEPPAARSVATREDRTSEPSQTSPMALRLKLDGTEVRAFCTRWTVAELAVFGSVTRDDLRSDSDFDVLVSPEPGVTWSLMNLGTMREELAALSGRPVDLLVRRAVEESPNWIRREAILGSAEVVFAAG